MADHGDRVLKLVAEPDYKPITLKAMSRRFEGRAPTTTPSSASAVKAAGQGGQARHRQGQDAAASPTAPGPIIGALPAVVEGVRVRPAAHVDGARPTRSTSRPTPAATPPAATRSWSRSPSGPRRPGMNPEGRIVQVARPGLGAVRRHLLRGGRRRLRQGRRHDVPRPDLRRRPRGQGGQAGRQGRPRDGPLPDARTSKARGSSPRSSARAGSRGSTPSSIIRAFNIPDTFDDDDARRGPRAGQALRRGRRSATGSTSATSLTVTIDPATARDFDDAITLSRDERGFWSLGVHIADVSHFVRPGSALDRTARHRGTSVYLPDRVIPMLPEVLSNSLASLQAGRTPLHRQRPAGVQRRGHPHRPPVRPLGDPGRPPVHLRAGDGGDEGTPTAEHRGRRARGGARCSARMLELAMILRRRRFARGALELNMPEVEIDLGDQGEVVGRPPRRRTTRATRSSRSSCSRPTRRSPRS